MQAKVIRITCTAGTGNQSFTGVGFQPKALVTLWQSTGSGFIANEGKAVGVTDGTTSRVVTSFMTDNVSTTATAKGYGNGILGEGQATGNSIVVATFVSFDSDGFTVNRTVSNTSSWDVLCLGGSDMRAFVKEFTIGNLTTQVVTGVGWQPNAIIFLASYAVTATANTGVARNSFSIGAAMVSAEWVVSYGGRDAATMTTAMGCTVMQLTTSCLFGWNATASTIDLQADLASLDSDGFTLNITNLPSGTTNLFLALCLDVPQAAVGAFNKPTGAAPQTSTITPSFAPKALLLASSGYVTSAVAGLTPLVTVGISDGTTEGSSWSHALDGTLPTDANRRHLNKVMSHNTAPSTAVAEGTAAFSSSGFTVTWTPNNAVAIEELYLALGDPPGPPVQGIRTLDVYSPRGGMTQPVAGAWG